MLAVFTRDATFTIAWFALMSFVWFGWSQEDPAPRHRLRLGVGAALGVALAIGFAVPTAINWHSPSALAGNYRWFGVLVGVEVLLAGAGCALVAIRGRRRWTAWWVGLVVAAHFLPLAWLLADASIAVLGVAQLAMLILLVPRLRRSRSATSRVVGPLMGASMLCYAGAAGVVLAAATTG